MMNILLITYLIYTLKTNLALGMDLPSESSPPTIQTKKRQATTDSAELDRAPPQKSSKLQENTTPNSIPYLEKLPNEVITRILAQQSTNPHSLLYPSKAGLTTLELLSNFRSLDTRNNSITDNLLKYIREFHIVSQNSPLEADLSDKIYFIPKDHQDEETKYAISQFLNFVKYHCPHIQKLNLNNLNLEDSLLYTFRQFKKVTDLSFRPLTLRQMEILLPFENLRSTTRKLDIDLTQLDRNSLQILNDDHIARSFIDKEGMTYFPGLSIISTFSEVTDLKITTKYQTQINENGEINMHYTDLSFLTDMPQLENLDLPDSFFSIITPEIKLPNLRRLNIAHTETEYDTGENFIKLLQPDAVPNLEQLIISGDSVSRHLELLYLVKDRNLKQLIITAPEKAAPQDLQTLTDYFKDKLIIDEK